MIYDFLMIFSFLVYSTMLIIPFLLKSCTLVASMTLCSLGLLFLITQANPSTSLVGSVLLGNLGAPESSCIRPQHLSLCAFGARLQVLFVTSALC